MEMRWYSAVACVGIVWSIACSSQTSEGDGDGDQAGGTGTGGAAGSATSGGAGAQAGAGRGGAATGGASMGGTSAGTPATGGISGSAGGAGVPTGGQSGAGVGGSDTGGSNGAPWSCTILAANENCYCGRTAEPLELTTCPSGMWPCCVYFTGEAQGVVQEGCACEGVPADECDAVANALQNGMRVANCPP